MDENLNDVSTARSSKVTASDGTAAESGVSPAKSVRRRAEAGSGPAKAVAKKEPAKREPVKKAAVRKTAAKKRPVTSAQSPITKPTPVLVQTSGPEPAPAVVPEPPIVPEPPVVPEPPALPDPPVVPEPPAVPDLPVVTEPDAVPDLPGVPDVPDVPDLPEVPDVPDRPGPTIAAEPSNAAEPPAVPAVASAADVQRAWQDNRLAQVIYHDWEAETYDEKWSISFDDRCISYARDRFSALVGPRVLRAEQWPYRKSLEIGAGTGFFSLNLRQAGVLDEVHVSDVSAGMVETAKRNAAGLGFAVTGAVAGAEALPYEDGTFDLVIGHAVIHHIPDVEAALREVLRVLRPGGRFVIAGEPTRIGDWYARRLGRITWKLTSTATQWPALREKWARSPDELAASSRAAALESVVDLHTFVPEELQAMAVRAGAVQVRTQTEELLAAFLGWPVRTFEAAVNPAALGWGWSRFAYRSWQRLSALDRVLSRVLPESIFYNVGVTGTKPAG